jgi:hypothetical protein
MILTFNLASFLPRYVRGDADQAVSSYHFDLAILAWLVYPTRAPT